MSRAQRASGVDKTRGRGGRSLDSSRDLVLREAALALLAEVGYDRLTMDAVAARARAGKTTIYRRWAGKAELVVDALNSLKGGRGSPGTGSLRRALGGPGGAGVPGRPRAAAWSGPIAAYSWNATRSGL